MSPKLSDSIQLVFELSAFLENLAQQLDSVEYDLEKHEVLLNLLLLFFGCILLYLYKSQKPFMICNEYTRRLAALNYEGSIPDAFIDSTTGWLMENPVILITEQINIGISFDKSSIDALFKAEGEHYCPITGRKILGFIINLNLKSAIENWIDAITENRLDNELRLDAFIDPITWEMMKKPVILVTEQFGLGASFDKSTAKELLKNPGEHYCPITYKKILGYIINANLKLAIENIVAIEETSLDNDFRL